jgi:hypothetical protein
MSSSPCLLSWTAILAAVFPLFLGCADFQRGEPSADAGVTPRDGGGGGDGGDSISFASAVHPLLISGCQSCHRSGGEAGDTGFVMTGDAEADYLEASSLIEASNPPASRLLRKGAGAGHGGGAIYGDGTPEYQTLLAWIAGGARP